MISKLEMPLIVEVEVKRPKLEDEVKRACACLYSPDEEEALQARLFLEKVRDRMDDLDNPSPKQVKLLEYVKKELET